MIAISVVGHGMTKGHPPVDLAMRRDDVIHRSAVDPARLIWDQKRTGGDGHGHPCLATQHITHTALTHKGHRESVQYSSCAQSW